MPGQEKQEEEEQQQQIWVGGHRANDRHDESGEKKFALFFVTLPAFLTQYHYYVHHRQKTKLSILPYSTHNITGYVLIGIESVAAGRDASFSPLMARDVVKPGASYAHRCH